MTEQNMLNPKREIQNPKQKKGRIQFLSSNDRNPKQLSFGI